MKYYIVMETKYKRRLWLFKTIEYQRPIIVFFKKKAAWERIDKLITLHGNPKVWQFTIEEVICE